MKSCLADGLLYHEEDGHVSSAFLDNHVSLGFTDNDQEINHLSVQILIICVG